MNCPECGTGIPDDRRVCQNCGARLGEEGGNMQPRHAPDSGDRGAPPGGQTLRKPESTALKTVCSILGMAAGFFFWQSFLGVAVLAGILYLIMYRGLKMSGLAAGIDFAVILHAASLLIGAGILLALAGRNIDILGGMVSLRIEDYIPDFLLNVALITLAGVFYARKSKGCLIAMMALESVYSFLNTINLYGMIALTDLHQAGTVLFHLAWRVLSVGMMAKYLADHLEEKKTGDTQSGDKPG